MSANKSFYLMCRGEQTQTLRKKHPFAFLLLTVIAERVRWNENNKSKGLQLLQCVIGTTEKLWVGCSRRQLRTAIQVLKNDHQIVTRTTNHGTVVTLINTDIVEVNTNKTTTEKTNHASTKVDKTTTNIKGNKKIEGIDLPNYFADNNVIHALAIELNKTNDSIKNLAAAFVKHCGFLKTTYSNNAAFALHRDFKNYVTQYQQAYNNAPKVPYDTPYYK